MTTATSIPNPRAWIGIALGGVALGTLDLVFAFTFWAMLRDVAPGRILQSIAAGLQGEAAFSGGTGSALLGAICHYFIAVMFVVAYYLAARGMRALIERPWLSGAAYGLVLYVVMSYVVVPLSNAPQPTKVYLPWIAASIIMHAVLGVMCAWSARWAHGRS